MGSEIVLDFLLNKALPVPDDATGRESWLREAIGWGDDPAPRFSLDPEELGDTRTWRLAWRLDNSQALSLDLVDEHGLGNDEPIGYRIQADLDLQPSATITEPQTDITVLPTAVVSVAGEATDDVAVTGIGLVAQILRPGVEEAEDLPFSHHREADATTVGIEADLDLAEFDLTEGDVVLLNAIADDGFELDGVMHEASVSPVRRLRVISELNFAQQLRRELSSVRQNAIRIEANQAELQDDVEDSGIQPGLKRAQGRLSDRIAELLDVVDQLEQELQRNRMNDEQLTELLQQSRDLLDYAGRASNRAVESIETDTEDNQELTESQQQVRDELTDLIRLLDRDEDTWIVKRRLESIIERQSELTTTTESLSQETIGKPLEDLTAKQRSELERITQQQRELRDQSQRLIDEMRRRAEALEEIDPQAASGMRKAAETGEQQEVDRQMETAAQRAEQNQLQSAGASQQSAQQTLNRMMNDLSETKRARTEELLRKLASLIDSIQRLIVVQENELMALDRARQADDYSSRDRAMIRLNQNTQSVAVDARAGGGEARSIARSLDRAADAQGAAVGALRARPVDADGAGEAENRSLILLQEAVRLAEELQQQTQDQQVAEQREALMEVYRVLGEMQVAARLETMELVDIKELSRRQLVEARRLGTKQDEIRTALSDVEADTQEIADSEIFTYVHQLMDEWSMAASESLWDGRVDLDVTDRQQMIAESIARQIEALREMMVPPDEFASEQNQGGGGGQSGPQPLIPPPAEMRRLHGLQQQVYDQTRSLDVRTDLPASSRRQRLRELGRMQRELIDLGRKMLEEMQGATPAPEPETE